jgi:hypothetical protein
MSGFGADAAVNPPGFPTPTNPKDILIRDNNGVTVFDSTTASRFVAVPFGGRLESLQWETDTQVLRATRHTAPKTGEIPMTLSEIIVPTNGEMDGRTYNRLPNRVKSFKVGLITVKAENVIWEEGFNLNMDVQDIVSVEGGRRVQPIAFRAQPGDGIGQVPACDEEDPPVRRINTVGPDDSGNFKVDTADCYRVQRPVDITNERPRQASIAADGLTAEQAAAAIEILNDCGPCCECDDFVRTYEGLRKLDNRYISLGGRAEGARDQLGLNLTRWENGRLCRVENPFRVVVLQEYLCTTAIGLNFCNLTEGCITPLTIRLTMQVFKDGVIDPSITATTFVCPETVKNGTDTNYEDRVYEMDGTYPVFDTRFDVADPQQSVKIRTRLKFNGCTDDQTLRVTLSAHYDKTLRPDESDAILPPVVTPPADIQTLWDSAVLLEPPRAILQKAVPISAAAICR